MSVYNIVRKRKVLETNLKSEEITGYTLLSNIFYIFKHFYSDFFQNFSVFFSRILLPVGGPIRLGIYYNAISSFDIPESVRFYTGGIPK